LTGAPRTNTRTVVVVPTTLITPPEMLLPGTLAVQFAMSKPKTVLLKEMSLPPADTNRPDEVRSAPMFTMLPGNPRPLPTSM
jgi:hypothetical protein